MTPAAWIMLGAALVSPLFTVVWWLVRRPVARLDRLEQAVFGESGVTMKLTKFATADALLTAVRGISEEGQRREDRILKAITHQTNVVGTEVRELRQQVREDVGQMRDDIREQNKRIDSMIRHDGR